LKTASTLSSIGQFANTAVKSGDLLSGAPGSIASRRENHVFLMHELIASLDACTCSPPPDSTEIISVKRRYRGGRAKSCGGLTLFTRSYQTVGLDGKQMSSFGEMFGRLLHATSQSRAAKTVEIYGWLIFAEGILILLFPQHVSALLRFGPLGQDGLMFFRLAGLLVAGIGMLYFVSGRMNAEGFVFATLLDRPLVPPIMVVLWGSEKLPGSLALLFAVQELASFLWTLLTWRARAGQR
jgi:hypothetical protein